MRLTALPISGRLQAKPADMVYGTPVIFSGSSGICSVRMKAGGLWRLQLNSFLFVLLHLLLLLRLRGIMGNNRKVVPL